MDNTILQISLKDVIIILGLFTQTAMCIWYFGRKFQKIDSFNAEVRGFMTDVKEQFKTYNSQILNLTNQSAVCDSTLSSHERRLDKLEG